MHAADQVAGTNRGAGEAPRIVSAARAVGTILFPIIGRELDKLIELIASLPAPAESPERPVLAVSIDTEFQMTERMAIEAAVLGSPHLHNCPLRFVECKQQPQESFYHRKQPGSFDLSAFPYGWKSGPNKQFFESLRVLLASNAATGSILLMETDSFPLTSLWLDRLNDELGGHGSFLVAGSKYRGLSRLPEHIANHLNGNSVYALSDPDFPKFLDLWERALLRIVRSEPWTAYDVVPAWAQRRSPSVENDPAAEAAWQEFAQTAKDRFVTLQSIANFGGSYENTHPIDETYPGFRSLRTTEIVHIRIPAIVRQHLAIKKEIETRLDEAAAATGRLLQPPRFNEANDCEDEWQFPGVTEWWASQKVRQSHAIPGNAAYVSFPWATLIDCLLHNPPEAERFISPLQDLASQKAKGGKRVTVCQHVHMLEFQYLFASLGITDVFWSHKPKHMKSFSKYKGIRLHPFPLYPVQQPDSCFSYGDRPYLFSFVGTLGSYYLTEVRNWIVKSLAGDKNGLIVLRDGWHYDKIVHTHQIKKALAPTDWLLNDNASAEFREILKRSVFSLCPSGSGPNSIRLWESIGAGAIPVVLSDSYDPPGDPDLWNEACVFWPEKKETIRRLPQELRAIEGNPALLARKRDALRQLWMRYGPQSFIDDIEKFFLNAASAVDNAASYNLLENDGSEQARDEELTVTNIFEQFEERLYASPTLARGQTLLEEGKWTEALPELLAAREEAPEDFDVLINLGECVFQHGDKETALTILLQASGQQPDSARALNDIGVVLEAMGRRQEAIGYFEKTLAIAPNYPRVCINLAAILHDANRSGEALALLEHAGGQGQDITKAEDLRRRIAQDLSPSRGISF